MPLYRNKTNTLSQITMLSNMRITTVQEAVAFLRALPPLYNQVCAVLQRRSVSEVMQKSQEKSQKVQPAPAPAPEPVAPEPSVVKVEPEKFENEGGYSAEETEKRIKELMEEEAKEKEAKESKDTKEAKETKEEKTKEEKEKK